MQPSKVEILLKDSFEPQSEIFDFEDYRIGYYLNRSLAKEKNEENEDSLFICEHEKGLIFGVADGAGGHPRGRDASVAISEFFLTNKNLSEHELIHHANQEVIELKAGAKSTLAFGSLSSIGVSFHCVGDSEAIYWNSHSREVYSSTPHSPVGLKVEAGVISQEESLEDPERNLVNTLMGDEFVKIHSTSIMSMKKGHSCLVGTDGLFDNISHRELDEVISGGTFDSTFQELVKQCNEQKNWIKDDDIAFILLRKLRA
ncbi:MAG: SpoIIE family protein phosphatase [Oligoflexia bacterium]|nr:SpoIIE family protein phosphatase [Oligoflexia bacterium]